MIEARSVALLAVSVGLVAACEPDYAVHEEKMLRTAEEVSAKPAAREQRARNPKAELPPGAVVRVAGRHHGSMERDFGINETVPEISLEITSPKAGQLIEKDVLELEVSLEGYETKPGSRHVHVIVDDEPYQAYYRAGEKPFEIDLKKMGLKPGVHTIRAFPSRPWHESIKVREAFATSHFYYKEKKGRPPGLSGPLFTYSRPKGTYEVGPRDNRILFDFFVSGTALDSMGHKVRYRVDGGEPTVLTSWVPVWFEGLEPGEHTLEVELLDQENEIVKGPYNSVKRRFTIVEKQGGS